ncbi:unnamed protein product [Amoebophrya sp. A25]|nr:unnamed protein product [Amoebophrya sp. A25]|eukprot:GSA25T00019095001.1
MDRLLQSKAAEHPPSAASLLRLFHGALNDAKNAQSWSTHTSSPKAVADQLDALYWCWTTLTSTTSESEDTNSTASAVVGALPFDKASHLWYAAVGQCAQQVARYRKGEGQRDESQLSAATSHKMMIETCWRLWLAADTMTELWPLSAKTAAGCTWAELQLVALCKLVQADLEFDTSLESTVKEGVPRRIEALVRLFQESLSSRQQNEAEQIKVVWGKVMRPPTLWAALLKLARAAPAASSDLQEGGEIEDAMRSHASACSKISSQLWVSCALAVYDEPSCEKTLCSCSPSQEARNLALVVETLLLESRRDDRHIKNLTSVVFRSCLQHCPQHAMKVLKGAFQVMRVEELRNNTTTSTTTSTTTTGGPEERTILAGKTILGAITQKSATDENIPMLERFPHSFLLLCLYALVEKADEFDDLVSCSEGNPRRCGFDFDSSTTVLQEAAVFHRAIVASNGSSLRSRLKHQAAVVKNFHQLDESNFGLLLVTDLVVDSFLQLAEKFEKDASSSSPQTRRSGKDDTKIKSISSMCAQLRASAVDLAGLCVLANNGTNSTRSAGSRDQRSVHRALCSFANATVPETYDNRVWSAVFHRMNQIVDDYLTRATGRASSTSSVAVIFERFLRDYNVINCSQQSVVDGRGPRQEALLGQAAQFSITVSRSLLHQRTISEKVDENRKREVQDLIALLEKVAERAVLTQGSDDDHDDVAITLTRLVCELRIDESSQSEPASLERVLADLDEMWTRLEIATGDQNLQTLHTSPLFRLACADAYLRLMRRAMKSSPSDTNTGTAAINANSKTTMRGATFLVSATTQVCGAVRVLLHRSCSLAECRALIDVAVSLLAIDLKQFFCDISSEAPVNRLTSTMRLVLSSTICAHSHLFPGGKPRTIPQDEQASNSILGSTTYVICRGNLLVAQLGGIGNRETTAPLLEQAFVHVLRTDECSLSSGSAVSTDMKGDNSERLSRNQLVETVKAIVSRVVDNVPSSSSSSSPLQIVPKRDLRVLTDAFISISHEFLEPYGFSRDAGAASLAASSLIAEKVERKRETCKMKRAEKTRNIRDSPSSDSEKQAVAECLATALRAWRLINTSGVLENDDADHEQTVSSGSKSMPLLQTIAGMIETSFQAAENTPMNMTPAMLSLHVEFVRVACCGVRQSCASSSVVAQPWFRQIAERLWCYFCKEAAPFSAPALSASEQQKMEETADVQHDVVQTNDIPTPRGTPRKNGAEDIATETEDKTSISNRVADHHEDSCTKDDSSTFQDIAVVLRALAWSQRTPFPSRLALLLHAAKLLAGTTIVRNLSEHAVFGCELHWDIAHSYRRAGLDRWAEHWLDSGARFAERFSGCDEWAKRFRSVSSCKEDQERRNVANAPVVDEDADAHPDEVNETYYTNENQWCLLGDTAEAFDFSDEINRIRGDLERVETTHLQKIEAILLAKESRKESDAVDDDTSTTPLENTDLNGDVAPPRKRRKIEEGKDDAMLVDHSLGTTLRLAQSLCQALTTGDFREVKKSAKLLLQFVVDLRDSLCLGTSTPSTRFAESTTGLEDFENTTTRLIQQLAPLCAASWGSWMLYEVRSLQGFLASREVLPTWSEMETLLFPEQTRSDQPDQAPLPQPEMRVRRGSSYGGGTGIAADDANQQGAKTIKSAPADDDDLPLENVGTTKVASSVGAERVPSVFIHVLSEPQLRLDEDGSNEKLHTMFFTSSAGFSCRLRNVPVQRMMHSLAELLDENRRDVKQVQRSIAGEATRQVDDSVKQRFWDRRQEFDERLQKWLENFEAMTLGRLRCSEREELFGGFLRKTEDVEQEMGIMGEQSSEDATSFNRSPAVLLYLDAAITNAPVEHMPLLRGLPIARALAPNMMASEDVEIVEYLHTKKKTTTEDEDQSARSAILLGSSATGGAKKNDRAGNSSGFYVLNPKNDAEVHDKKLLPVLRRLQWSGTVGKAPSKRKLFDLLCERDTFLFSGHYGGEQYVNAEQLELGRSKGLKKIRAVDEKKKPPLSEGKHVRGFAREGTDQDPNRVCEDDRIKKAMVPILKEHTISKDALAASLLMGCSSTKQYAAGYGDEGFGTHAHYLIGGAPVVVGCLWEVLAGEVDKFTANVLNDWHEDEKRSSSSTASGAASLLRCLEGNRQKCRLPHLTGCAVVQFGLPRRTTN